MLGSPPEVESVHAAAEIDSIRAQRDIRVTGLREDLPIYTIDDRGELTGLAGAIIELIETRTGLRFHASSAESLNAGLERAKRGETDAVLNVSPAAANHASLVATRAYLRGRAAYIGRRDAPDFAPDFAGLTFAVEDGSPLRQVLAAQYPNAILKAFGRFSEALVGLSRGEADVFFGSATRAGYLVELLRLDNLEVRARPAVSPQGPRIAVRSDWPLLVSIIDKALDTITAEEELGLRRRWVPAPVLLRERARQARLSDEEREWIARAGPVIVGYHKAFPPISFQSDEGGMAGIAADYFRLLQTRLGMRTAEVRAGTWSETLRDVRAGRIDMVVAAARSEARRPYLTFVGPFTTSPTAIVVRHGAGRLGALAALRGMQLAVLRDHFLVDALTNVLPAIGLLLVDTQAEALDAVANDQAAATIGNLDVVSRMVAARYAGKLAISGTVPGGDSELYFGVRNDAPMLARVLEAGLETITEAEHAQIRGEWLTVQIRQSIPWSTILAYGIPVVMLMFMVPLWFAWRARARAAVRIAAILVLYAALSEANQAIARMPGGAPLMSGCGCLKNWRAAFRSRSSAKHWRQTGRARGKILNRQIAICTCCQAA